MAMAVANAIYDAAYIGCDVINLSLGSYDYSTMIQSAVNYAYDCGCIIVASAGNSGALEYAYPASCNGVISVGSVSKSLQRSFSTYNNVIDVMAPGEYMFTTGAYYDSLGTYYVTYSGTSFSAPCVSGIAALVVCADPNISVDTFNAFGKYGN